ALYDYLVAHNPPPDPVLRDLAAETAALGPISRMQIAVEQGALLTFLARVLGARRAVEIGTFTGYSAISIARGLVPDGGPLWGGSVADPSDTSDDTVALRALNDFLVRDERVDLVMLPVADGLTLARKR